MGLWKGNQYQFLIIITLMQGKENANPNQAYLFNNGKINKELRGNEYLRDRTAHCQKHNEEIGKYFCFDCLLYNLCAKCCEEHAGHEIKRYGSANQAKEETKEVLLIEVESTLNRLKGRENELKNQIEEISLIKHTLQSLSNEVLATLRQQLDQLQQKIHDKLKAEFERYQRELDVFYREYNHVNEYLRENLLRIIDGEVNIHTFSRRNVAKDIDLKLMPQFGKIKLVMEKCKKHLRGVRESAKEMETAIRFFSNEEEKNQIKFEKYDKFLKEKSYSEECNAPLMRTLNLLEDHHPDLTALRTKLRN